MALQYGIIKLESTRVFHTKPRTPIFGAAPYSYKYHIQFQSESESVPGRAFCRAVALDTRAPHSLGKDWRQRVWLAGHTKFGSQFDKVSWLINARSNSVERKSVKVSASRVIIHCITPKARWSS